MARKQRPSKVAAPKGATRKRKSGSSESIAKARAEARELKEALAEASGTRGRRKGRNVVARALSAKERSAMKGLVIYLDEEARKQLARIAIDEGCTTQDLGVQAINMLFQFYRVGRIA